MTSFTFGFFWSRFPGSILIVVPATRTFARGGSIGTLVLVFVLLLVLLGLGPLGSYEIGSIMANRGSMRTRRTMQFLLRRNRVLRSRKKDRRIRIPVAGYIIKKERYFRILTIIGRRAGNEIRMNRRRRSRSLGTNTCKDLAVDSALTLSRVLNIFFVSVICTQIK